jgi:hypothetical protein
MSTDTTVLPRRAPGRLLIPEQLREGEARGSFAAIKQSATQPWVILGAIVVIAIVLRFTGLTQQSLWGDEIFTATDLKPGLGAALHNLAQNESIPPLYYLIAWPWSRVFGGGAFALRSLSALAGVLTVPVVYLAGARLASRRVGVIAAGLVAVNPELVWYSQEVRVYAFYVLTAAVLMLAWAYALEDPTPRRLALWTAAAILSLTVYYFSLFLVIGQAVWLLRRYPRRQLATAAAALAATIAALAPLALHQSGSGRVDWITTQPLSGRLRVTITSFLINGGAHHGYPGLLVVVAGVIAGALTLLAVRSGRREQRAGMLALSVAGIGLGLPVVLALAHYDRFYFRTVMGTLPAFLIGVAAGLGASRARKLGYALAAVWCAVSIIPIAAVRSDAKIQRDDWRDATRLIGPARPQWAVLALSWVEELPVEVTYYRPDLTDAAAGTPTASIRIRELSVIDLLRQRVAAPNIPPGFSLVGTITNGNYRVLLYRASRPEQVSVAWLISQNRYGGLSYPDVLVPRRSRAG